ncbi:MAG: hypothetical protein LUD46_22955 [Parabacteroides sp.]|nr:hypothetical protein [Parabacteroides sp.]
MNKKSTLLAAALMAVSSLTVSAEDGQSTLKGEGTTAVTSAAWKAGNYYYLKTVVGKYLSLDCGK